MVILIGGATHTGKTAYAQKLLEQRRYPYLSIDHLKMGLIRSGQTDLTPMDDDQLTVYLWPILREMIKTAIENRQNMIIEGCYIPFDWQKDFTPEYLSQISYTCLIMSEAYIRRRFADIVAYASVIESRLDDSDLDMETLVKENAHNLAQCRAFGLPYIFIDEGYSSTLERSNGLC